MKRHLEADILGILSVSTAVKLTTGMFTHQYLQWQCVRGMQRQSQHRVHRQLPFPAWQCG